MYPIAHAYKDNYLHRTTQAQELAHIQDGLESVDLPLGKVLYEVGDMMSHAYCD